MLRALCKVFAIALLIGGLLLVPKAGISEDRLPPTDRMWHQLLGEANAMGLPTKFLNAIPPSFIQFEFDDLHSYAAEYHPGEHRLVLNRALSFNGAGATLRPLGRLTHVQIETLYHELFHAYLDYLVTTAEASPETARTPVLTFARIQQGCHYGAVWITPVAQREGDAEERFLTDRESWEALNETWAVFVGWAVWNQLELTSSTGRSIQKPGKNQDEWIRRLKSADHERTLRGYYEPEDSRERAVVRKRYLAPASRLSEREAEILMKDVLEFSPTLLARARGAFSGGGGVIARDDKCGSG
jgi:hypothetical protein